MPRNLHSHEVILIGDVGNGLTDAIWERCRRLSEMGLNIPSKEYDGESSWMDLKMPSKIDVNFIRILFAGIPVPAVRGGVHWGMSISVLGNRV